MQKKTKILLAIGGIGAAVAAGIAAFARKNDIYLVSIKKLDEDDFEKDDEDSLEDADDGRTRYCACCGKEVHNSDNYCKYCGEIIE